MGDPVVLFATVGQPWSQLERSWALFQTKLDPRAVGRAIPADGVIWRLLASNHRELARSARVYPTFEEAHTHLLELRADPQRLQVHVVVVEPTSYGWTASDTERRTMTCARWYANAADSLAGGRAAIAALARAEVAGMPHRTTTSGRRTSRQTTRTAGRPTG
ncbi:hypothetical protein ABCS02_08525 [Microbacterium sp. X-17]|uniref:hypothetical protein n=1 Tax=Microbacterium sp. X-17 TaxID=3144404 RepID=UPI0031F565E1